MPQRFKCHHAKGKRELDALEEPRIKPMSRRRYNNATLAKLRAQEKKMRKVGNRTTYLVGGSDLGKIAYDYTRYLLSERKPKKGKARRIAAGPAV